MTGKIYLGVVPCNGVSLVFKITIPVINENNVQNTVNVQYDTWLMELSIKQKMSQSKTLI